MAFQAKVSFLAISHHHGNHFPYFFSPCFKLGQNLLSCQVSEKLTHRFGQNDGTNIHTDRQAGRQADRQTDRQTDRCTDGGREEERETDIHISPFLYIEYIF